MNFFGTFSHASMASSSQVTSAFLKGSRVVVALYLSGLVPEDAVEVGTLLAVAAGVHRVAGAAPVLTTPSMRRLLAAAAAGGRARRT